MKEAGQQRARTLQAAGHQNSLALTGSSLASMEESSARVLKPYPMAMAVKIPALEKSLNVGILYKGSLYIINLRSQMQVSNNFLPGIFASPLTLYRGLSPLSR